MPVDVIDTEAVLSVLKPLVDARARDRVAPSRAHRDVLDAAKARGFIGRNKANPARWRGHLDKLLPNPDKLGERGHHAAMPYTDVPAFITKLRARDTTAARALEFRNPHGDAIGRSAGGVLGRNRHGRQGLDDFGAAHKGIPRAPRPSVRSRASDPRGNGSRL